MALNIREGFWGVEHLRIALFRRVFRKPEDAFMKRYEGMGANIERVLDTNGSAKICERCGYLLMRARFPNNWTMEMCSAFPLVKLDNPKFKDWFTQLTEEKSTKLPLEPILHE